MAVINQPPTTAVDGSGDVVATEWRNFFTAVFNVCLAVTSSGSTAQRPTKLLWTGRPYFDTTLGKPIWFKTVGWVDATGANV